MYHLLSNTWIETVPLTIHYHWSQAWVITRTLNRTFGVVSNARISHGFMHRWLQYASSTLQFAAGGNGKHTDQQECAVFVPRSFRVPACFKLSKGLLQILSIYSGLYYICHIRSSTDSLARPNCNGSCYDSVLLFLSQWSRWSRGCFRYNFFSLAFWNGGTSFERAGSKEREMVQLYVHACGDAYYFSK